MSQFEVLIFFCKINKSITLNLLFSQNKRIREKNSRSLFTSSVCRNHVKLSRIQFSSKLEAPRPFFDHNTRSGQKVEFLKKQEGKKAEFRRET